MTRTRIRRLVRACRPRSGRAKVELKESQLTCMYNLLSGDLSQNFKDYPSDMLLYLKSKDVNRANCRSYLSAVGAADFSVASSLLNKDSLLLNEARTCLGISGVKLSTDNLEVLGNMACTLDSSYIQNADPLILEKLQVCKDFSDSQKTKRQFLKKYMPKLRKKKTQKRKLKRLFKQCGARKTKRGAGCTVGNITQVTVNDGSFPFGYDQTQFDLCLDIPVLQNNLLSICEKVDDDDFQKVILKKLNQAYPSGISDEVVKVLGSVSRVASLDDISKWKITKIDTLAALMKADDGPWEAAKSKAIITKYLNTGKSLAVTELNSIGSNLCTLDTSTLKTITTDSIRNAKPLDVASCSSEQKRVLYEISNTSFSSQRASVFYNLIKTYLCGAPLSDVVALSNKSINMDINTFRSLDPNVITGLTVANVQGLMGYHLQDLKDFENDTTVKSWVNKQLQTDLDLLGLGLISNRTTPATAPPSSAGTNPETNTVTPQGNASGLNATLTTKPVTTANTTSGGVEIAKHPAFIFLAALLTTVLQILQQPA
ncbi:mesothelin-like protein [Enoplosus armatus]|uniref:mesothelin-like protein n=1 Tax=Enoplosus armatus TaxID=215367 RepID=UPI0039951A43